MGGTIAYKRYNRSYYHSTAAQPDTKNRIPRGKGTMHGTGPRYYRLQAVLPLERAVLPLEAFKNTTEKTEDAIKPKLPQLLHMSFELSKVKLVG